MTEDELRRLVREHNEAARQRVIDRKERNRKEYRLFKRLIRLPKEEVEFNTSATIEHERSVAVDSLKGMSVAKVRNRLKKIYDHLPVDMIKFITKTYLKHHR